MNYVARFSISLVIATMLTACVAMKASYDPPTRLAEEEKAYSAVVDKSYDANWSALIRHAAGTFFAIDNFEKESGLLTLSFGSADASAFVDCGNWTSSWTGQDYRPYSFSGPYVDYLAQYHNGTFSGKMNLLVTELGPEESQITVNARYILQSSPNTWSFDSGGSATINVAQAAQSAGSPARTCQPTYKAERSIMEAVKNL